MERFIRSTQARKRLNGRSRGWSNNPDAANPRRRSGSIPGITRAGSLYGAFGGAGAPRAGSGRGREAGRFVGRLSSLIGAGPISDDERRLAVHLFGREGHAFLFVRFPCFAVTFPAQWHRRTPRRVRKFWPESFESINLGLPNQIISANAGKRLSFAVKSRVGLSPRPGVAEFRRSVHAGPFKQPIGLRNECNCNSS